MLIMAFWTFHYVFAFFSRELNEKTSKETYLFSARFISILLDLK